MITVSLIKELEFVSSIYGGKLQASIKMGEGIPEVKIQIEKSKLTIFFLNKTIWQESISEASSNFGIESCETIARIMGKALKGEEWENSIPHIFP